MGLNLPIILGATVILLPTFEAEETYQRLVKEKPTFMAGVPAMYTALYRASPVVVANPLPLKACLSSLAPLTETTQHGFASLIAGFLLEGYGSAETAGLALATPLETEHPLEAGSVGLPLPNVEARVVDLATGADLPPGQIGELWLKGPQVTPGYWSAQGSSTPPPGDGWLRTGDLASRDSHGYVRLMGRKADLIRVGDTWVFPAEVEKALADHEQVWEVAVVGLPTAAGRPKIKAFVVLYPGAQLSQEDLLQLARQYLRPEAVPAKIEFCETLPKKSFAGKILKRALTTQATPTPA